MGYVVLEIVISLFYGVFDPTTSTALEQGKIPIEMVYQTLVMHLPFSFFSLNLPGNQTEPHYHFQIEKGKSLNLRFRTKIQELIYDPVEENGKEA
jgi:hypothetical protein